MDIHDWIKLKQVEFEEKLTEEARRLNLITDQIIGCSLRIKSGDYKYESVYPAPNLHENSQQILELSWSDKHREVLRLLILENPKDFKTQRDRWWESRYQQSINTIFRAASMPWRIVLVGPWKRCKIYIGTIEQTQEVFLERLCYKNEGILLVNSRILFEHKKK